MFEAENSLQNDKYFWPKLQIP